MFIESLFKLALAHEYHEQQGTFLVDEKFHKETLEILELSSRQLHSELEFKNNDPGPWTFGIGEFTINIFSPDHTGEIEWAAISRFGEWQKNYKFNSLMSFIKILKLSFVDFNGHLNGEQKTT